MILNQESLLYKKQTNSYCKLAILDSISNDCVIRSLDCLL